MLASLGLRQRPETFLGQNGRPLHLEPRLESEWSWRGSSLPLLSFSHGSFCHFFSLWDLDQGVGSSTLSAKLS